VNDARKKAMAQRIIAAMGGSAKGKTIGVLGLAFKPNTDDMRDAPSRTVVAELTARGATVQAYDPVAMEEAARVMPDVPGLRFASGWLPALEGADALLVVTEWKEIRNPDFESIKATLRDPVIFDGRNLYEPKLMKSLGIHYHAVGRGEAA
jgi:UDPglucose 6-dehydrogenase